MQSCLSCTCHHGEKLKTCSRRHFVGCVKVNDVLVAGWLWVYVHWDAADSRVLVCLQPAPLIQQSINAGSGSLFMPCAVLTVLSSAHASPLQILGLWRFPDSKDWLWVGFTNLGSFAETRVVGLKMQNPGFRVYVLVVKNMKRIIDFY